MYKLYVDVCVYMSEFIKRTAVGELCLNFNPGRVWELPVGRPHACRLPGLPSPPRADGE